jgi:hypothetical protein
MLGGATETITSRRKRKSRYGPRMSKFVVRSNTRSDQLRLWIVEPGEPKRRLR